MTDTVATLKDALGYPWNGGAAGVTLVVGGILTLLSPLIVPGVVVLGYGLRVVEANMDGARDPPTFEDPGTLFVDGLKGLVVLVVYVLVPLFIGTLVLGALAGAMGFRFAGPLSLRQGFAAGGLTLAVVLLLAGLLLVLTYVAPAALVHLARTRRLGAAFSFADVDRLVRTDAYGAAWLLALAVFAGAGVVMTVLYTAAIGVVVSGFVTFYAFVAMAYLYAHGAREAGFELAALPADAPATPADGDPGPEADH